jgi:hypothetical protein
MSGGSRHQVGPAAAHQSLAENDQDGAKIVFTFFAQS